MDQRVSLITLGVADLARARTFYGRLGWQGQEVEETVFFQAGGLALVLWSRQKLAQDSRVIDEGVDGFGGITLAHNVRTKEEVDAIVSTAQHAGATVTRPPADTFYGGYAGCFTDPDGHVWEIAYNPGFPLADDGSISIPEFSSS
jgi:uncharacterized protein